MPSISSDPIWDSLICNQERLESDIALLREVIWEERRSRNRATPKLIQVWRSFIKEFEVMTSRETDQYSNYQDSQLYPSPSYSYRELNQQNLELKDFVLKLYQIFINKSSCEIHGISSFDFHDES
jgi:hypothetical protein